MAHSLCPVDLHGHQIELPIAPAEINHPHVFFNFDKEGRQLRQPLTRARRAAKVQWPIGQGDTKRIPGLTVFRHISVRTLRRVKPVDRFASRIGIIMAFAHG